MNTLTLSKPVTIAISCGSDLHGSVCEAVSQELCVVEMEKLPSEVCVLPLSHGQHCEIKEECAALGRGCPPTLEAGVNCSTVVHG